MPNIKDLIVAGKQTEALTLVKNNLKNPILAATDENGWTLLHWAAAYKIPHLYSELLGCYTSDQKKFTSTHKVTVKDLTFPAGVTAGDVAISVAPQAQRGGNTSQPGSPVPEGRRRLWSFTDRGAPEEVRSRSGSTVSSIAAPADVQPTAAGRSRAGSFTNGGLQKVLAADPTTNFSRTRANSGVAPTM